MFGYTFDARVLVLYPEVEYSLFFFILCRVYLLSTIIDIVKFD